VKLFEYSFANYSGIMAKSGQKIRLYLSSESAEIMPEILSALAKRTAGTLSFNHLEATSLLKTQPLCTIKPIETNSGEEMTPVGLFTSNWIFRAITEHRAKGIRLHGCCKTVMQLIGKNCYLLYARIQDHQLL
jgi:hypothetical protein